MSLRMLGFTSTTKTKNSTQNNPYKKAPFRKLNGAFYLSLYVFETLLLIQFRGGDKLKLRYQYLEDTAIAGALKLIYTVHTAQLAL